MTKDEVIALAKQAAFHTPVMESELLRFANLIEEHLTYSSIHSCHPGCTKPACVAMREAVLAEREACAKMAEAFHRHGYDFTGNEELHEAIRSRT